MSSLFRGLYYDTDSRPTLKIGDEVIAPLGRTGTLSFDTAQRYCIGWHDLATGENNTCPENAQTDPKYDTCPACQRRTGFNPAFYHASSVSPQQEARNSEPHTLYLAYMGPGYLKVGISWHKRGLRRLLDQGARSAIILETFPSALIARQYEAKIAALPTIHETTPTRTKLKLLELPRSDHLAKKELLAAKHTIEQSLKITFASNEILHFTDHYHASQQRVTSFTTLVQPPISGHVIAVVGDIMFTQYNDRFVALALKRYTGYPATFEATIQPLDLPAEQVSLFG